MRQLGTLLFAGIALCSILSAADDPSQFPQLVDELERAATPKERGFDQGIHAFKRPGNRVVQMLGAAETWDAYGTPELRQAIIARWRKRWSEQGPAMLLGMRSTARTAGEAKVATGKVQLSRRLGDMRALFFLNNRRLYEMGAMDGSFPPVAFMLGDQSGVWTPPVKALDGFEFTVREAGQKDWKLAECSQFTHDFASASFHFAQGGWQVERLDFPHPEKPILFSRLTLTNASDRERTVVVEFKARVNIRPDWRTAAHNTQQNDLDIVEGKDGIVRAWDPQLAHSLVVLASDQGRTQVEVSEAIARLTCRVAVPARSAKAVTFVIAGGFDFKDSTALGAAQEFARRAEDALKAQRTQIAERTQQGVHFTCSDAQLTETFALAKANLALIAADYRPHFPEVFLPAGVPVYPRLFACDACISLPGVMAAGRWNEAHGTLAGLAAQARKNGNLVPHESATDGTQIGPSNAQETTQFIATCWRYYQWTGDRAFLVELHPLLNAALREHQKRFDKDDSGYPAGNALVETKGMGPKKIDAACWQYAALSALADTAQALGKSSEAQRFRGEANGLHAAIQRDWWLPAESMWADSLDEHKKPKSDGLWSVVFPLLTGVATEEQTRMTLDGLERGWVNQWGGVHTRQPDISRQGSGVVTTNLFATAAFAGGKPDLGLSLLRKASEAPRQERMPGGFTEMIPPGGSDFVQLWSVGPFLEAVVEGLAGIRPQAAQHRADVFPSLPAGLEWFSLENLRIGAHTVALDVRRKDSRVNVTLTHVAGPSPLEGRWQIAPINRDAGFSSYHVAPGEMTELKR